MTVAGYLKLSIAVALATIALKAGAWWVSGSVGLMSDALESFVNLAGAMFALQMVTVAARPPDREHPFGHHKAEYLSSAFEGLLIFGAAAVILWSAVPRFADPQPLQSIDVGLGLSVAGAALNGGLAFAMLRKAKAARSMALEADARHLYTDVWTTLGVVVGIGAVAATGWLWLDPAIAVVVALNILREGARLVYTSADSLLDRALDGDARTAVDRVLRRYDGGVLRIDHVVTRRAGRRRDVELHLHVPASWTLGRAAGMRAELERELIDAVPGVRATIQLLPLDVEAAEPAVDAGAEAV